MEGIKLLLFTHNKSQLVTLNDLNSLYNCVILPTFGHLGRLSPTSQWLKLDRYYLTMM